MLLPKPSAPQGSLATYTEAYFHWKDGVKPILFYYN